MGVRSTKSVSAFLWRSCLVFVSVSVSDFVYDLPSSQASIKRAN